MKRLFLYLILAPALACCQFGSEAPITPQQTLDSLSNHWTAIQGKLSQAFVWNLADSSYYGITISDTVGEAVTFGEALYFKSDGHFWKANASDTTKMPCTAVAVSAAEADNPATILLYGYIRASSWSFSVGKWIYPDNSTAGDFTATRPSTSDHEVQEVGYAVTIDIIRFEPDRTRVRIQ